MKIHIQRHPFADAAARRLRLLGAGAVSLAVGILTVWNPLTQPGPRTCLLRNAVGLPCPLCGLTRGVSLCLRGQPLDATHFNPLAVPALLAGIFLIVLWLVEYVSGRRIVVAMPAWLRRGLFVAGCLILMANWSYLLTYRREDPFAATWLGRLWSLGSSAE